MKSSYLLAAAVLAQLVVGQMSYAQSQELNAEVDAEIEQMYKTSNVGSTQAPVQVQQQSTQPVVTQTIYVPQQPAVQKQPETQVESSPLTNSRADSIRRGRQEEELRTETRIVEKLEQSRLEDEKKRAAVLFGDKFDTLQNQQQHTQTVQPVVAPVVQPVQVPVQAPSSQVQPVIINQNESLTRDAVREEVRAALSEDHDAVVPAFEQRYFSAIAGIGQYPDVQAIKGNYSLGAAFGTRFDFFLVEGAFVFSNYSVEGTYGYGSFAQPLIADFDMNQYQGIVSTKYQLLGGFVRPVVGGLISYSYREYALSQQNNYLTNYYGLKGGTSHAVDLGLIAGVDLEFNSKMSFGVDMKYMFNMSSKISGNVVSGIQTPEKLQYFTTGLFARVNF
ncbi:MAG: hypothetical protein ACK4VO_03445 [Pseudobdellovibrio sp.]